MGNIIEKADQCSESIFKCIHCLSTVGSRYMSIRPDSETMNHKLEDLATKSFQVRLGDMREQ
jgi:hypothetical protein